MKKLTKSQIKVLSVIYMATDCSNEVYDYAHLHHMQAKIADSMPALVTSINGCVPVDGDGFSKDNYTEGRGFRLTQAGYEALTESNQEMWPRTKRRFANTATIERKEER